MSKCAWCGGEFQENEGEEWSSYEALLSCEPAVARLNLWLSPIDERFKKEPIALEVHVGECYRTARDELRRAVFSSPVRRELRPDSRRAVMPHGWWHLLEEAQKGDRPSVMKCVQCEAQRGSQTWNKHGASSAWVEYGRRTLVGYEENPIMTFHGVFCSPECVVTYITGAQIEYRTQGEKP